MESDAEGQLHVRMRDVGTGQIADFPPLYPMMHRIEDIERTWRELSAAGEHSQAAPFTYRVTSDVCFTLSLDLGDQWVMVSREMLSSIGLDMNAARQGAIVLLYDASRRMVISEAGITSVPSEGLIKLGASPQPDALPGVFRIDFPEDPDLTASFMLNAGDWLREGILNGTPVFSAGTRDVLYVCGSGDRRAVEHLRRLTGKHYFAGLDDPEEHGQPLSLQLFTFDGHRIHQFDPSP